MFSFSFLSVMEISALGCIGSPTMRKEKERKAGGSLPIRETLLDVGKARKQAMAVSQPQPGRAPRELVQASLGCWFYEWASERMMEYAVRLSSATTSFRFRQRP